MGMKIIQCIVIKQWKGWSRHTTTYTLDFNYEASLESLHVHILHKLKNDERNEYISLFCRGPELFLQSYTTPLTSQGPPHPAINLRLSMRLFWSWGPPMKNTLFFSGEIFTSLSKIQRNSWQPFWFIIFVKS